MTALPQEMQQEGKKVNLQVVKDHQAMNPNNSVVHLETQELFAWFGQRMILANVNLAFPENSVTALIGPSGCGKSTFIRILNRMHEFIPGAALAGKVYYQGIDIYAREVDPVDIRTKVGMVFQKPNPFPTMSIKDNVLSGLRLAQIPFNNAEEIVQNCLKKASLWNETKDRLNASAQSLSGGQQQRLCIARSLAVSPDVLLMDEPCSALDPASTLRIEETIRELSQTMTIVIVTHNMQQAARVSDYTAFFLADNSPGKLIETGVTSVIFYKPEDQRTLDYVNGRFG